MKGFVLFAAVLALAAAPVRAFEPGEWVWCDVETKYVAGPHTDCPALDGAAPFYCPECEGFFRPETAEEPHVHVIVVDTQAGTQIDAPTTPAVVKTDRSEAQGSEKDGRPRRLRRRLATLVMPAIAAFLLLRLFAVLLRRGKTNRATSKKRIAWRWKRGVPQGLELVPGSLVCRQDSGNDDGGTAMVYEAKFLEGGRWIPAIVKRIVGNASWRKSDVVPALRFEASVLEALAGTEVAPRLLAGPFENASVGAERWPFYAMSVAAGRPWPNQGGLGRDTKLALHALCEALEKIHACGIGHHDVKPQNVFWDARTKSASLIDFGSAVFHGGGPANPLGSSYPKSEPWVAPSGDGKCLSALSTASDVWVYGLMFCEAFVGGIADRSRWPERTDDREWLRRRIATKTSSAVADAVVDGLLAPATSGRMPMRDFRAILEQEWEV